MLKVEIDSQTIKKRPKESVKIILATEYPHVERHVNVTHEGIVVDIVVDGEVTETMSTTHEEMLDASDSELWYCQSCEYDGTATEFSPTDGRPDVPTCPKCESTNCFTKD